MSANMYKQVLNRERQVVSLPEPCRLRVHAKEVAYCKALAERSKSSRSKRLWHTLFPREVAKCTPTTRNGSDEPELRWAPARILIIQALLLRRLPVEIVTAIIDHALSTQLVMHTLELGDQMIVSRLPVHIPERSKLKPDEVSHLYRMDSASQDFKTKVPAMNLPSLAANLGEPILSTFTAPYLSDPETPEFIFQDKVYRGPRIGPCVNIMIIEVSAIHSPAATEESVSRGDPLGSDQGWVDFALNFWSPSRESPVVSRARIVFNPADIKWLPYSSEQPIARHARMTVTPTHLNNTPHAALAEGADWKASNSVGCLYSDDEKGLLKASWVIGKGDASLGKVIGLLREGDSFEVYVRVNHPRLIELVDCKVRFFTSYRPLLQHLPDTWLAKCESGNEQ